MRKIVNNGKKSLEKTKKVLRNENNCKHWEKIVINDKEILKNRKNCKQC